MLKSELKNITLNDKYELENGKVYVTGTQALVRLPILQKKRLVQSEYSPGPLRQKIFGDPRLPNRHVATGYRR